MMLYFSFFLILLLKVEINQAVVYYNNYEYTSAVRLNNYDSYYGNAKFLRYSIPNDVTQAQWFFQVRSAPSCPATPVYIYLEYSGYPVIAPLNETFPTGFDINRLTKRFVILNVTRSILGYGSQNTQINITSPKSGYWYSAVFYINDDIPKISSCFFHLASLTNIWVNEDVTVLSLNTPTTYTKDTNLSSNQFYKYLTSSHDSIEVNIQLDNNTSDTLCVLNSFSRQSALPIIDTSYDTFINCTNLLPCLFTIQYPVTKTWYYISITTNCTSYVLSLNTITQSNLNIIKTSRIIGSSPYNIKYYLNPSNTYILGTDSTPNFLEYLFDHSTIGGTLNLHISNRIATTTNVSNISVYFNGCFMFNSLEQYAECQQGYRLKTRSFIAGSSSSQVSIPYPMSGNWYLVLWQECTDTLTDSSVECPQVYPVGATVQVSTDQCANNYCGDSGTCNIVSSGTNLISVCKCNNNFGGYACTASLFISNGTFISDNVGEVLFLTLSNLVFFIPIFLALDRRWFIEALIYSYTMFFSIFYHACSATSYSFCIFNLNGLQLADYIGAYSSFVITILFIGDINRYWQLFGYFLGIFLCIALSLSDRSNTAAFVIIIVIAGLVTIGSWINVWWQTGEVYPPKRELLIYIPGLILAITGIILFLVVGSGSNYWLTHSFWHMLIAFSLIFFMPEGEGEPLFKFIRELVTGESYSSDKVNTGNTINSRGNAPNVYRSNEYF